METLTKTVEMKPDGKEGKRKEEPGLGSLSLAKWHQLHWLPVCLWEVTALAADRDVILSMVRGWGDEPPWAQG